MKINLIRMQLILLVFMKLDRVDREYIIGRFIAENQKLKTLEEGLR